MKYFPCARSSFYLTGFFWPNYNEDIISEEELFICENYNTMSLRPNNKTNITVQVISRNESDKVILNADHQN